MDQSVLAPAETLGSHQDLTPRSFDAAENGKQSSARRKAPAL